jgi:hypothetical protein
VRSPVLLTSNSISPTSSETLTLVVSNPKTGSIRRNTEKRDKVIRIMYLQVIEWT